MIVVEVGLVDGATEEFEIGADVERLEDEEDGGSEDDVDSSS